MKTFLYQQYAYTKRSRESLLDYCSTIKEADFVAEISLFGRASIRNLLVHTANAYEFWIGEHALKKKMVYTAYETVREIEEAKALFATVDSLLEEFCDKFEENLPEIEIELNGHKDFLSHLQLFTHVMTHEFHHKGQILSLSRHLGYTPIDTGHNQITHIL